MHIPPKPSKNYQVGIIIPQNELYFYKLVSQALLTTPVFGIKIKINDTILIT